MIKLFVILNPEGIFTVLTIHKLCNSLRYLENYVFAYLEPRHPTYNGSGEFWDGDGKRTSSFSDSRMFAGCTGKGFIAKEAAENSTRTFFCEKIEKKTNFFQKNSLET